MQIRCLVKCSYNVGFGIDGFDEVQVRYLLKCHCVVRCSGQLARPNQPTIVGISEIQ
jgi:hypothetical protein